jgi:diketogulonate reductase-like aldo/keto reductase
MPYDPSAPLAEQLATSVASSLANLATPSAGEEEEEGDPYIDSLVLHSPLQNGRETVAALDYLHEHFVIPGKIRHLGTANTPFQLVSFLARPHLDSLSSLPSPVEIKVVQNRFHGRTAYETELRALCREKGIVFQTFWTLTGNPALVGSALVAQLADAVGVSKEVAFYALVLGLEGTTILDGTTSVAHMREDLDGVKKVGRWAEGDGKEAWDASLRRFKEAVGDV